MREAHWGRGAKPLSIGSEKESEGVVGRGRGSEQSSRKVAEGVLV